MLRNRKTTGVTVIGSSSLMFVFYYFFIQPFYTIHTPRAPQQLGLNPAPAHSRKALGDLEPSKLSLEPSFNVAPVEMSAKGKDHLGSSSLLPPLEPTVASCGAPTINDSENNAPSVKRTVSPVLTEQPAPDHGWLSSFILISFKSLHFQCFFKF